MPLRFRILGSLLALSLASLTVAEAAGIKYLDLPLKRGQEKIDAKKLPLACLTVVLLGKPMRLREFKVESLDTKQEFSIDCTTGQKALHQSNLLTAAQGKDRFLSMAIFSLPPGRYRLLTAYFEYQNRKDASDRVVSMYFYHQEYSFTVTADAANYLGSLIVGADWDAPDRKTPATFVIEDTSQRDLRWSIDMIPGMAKVPAVTSTLEVKPRTP